MFMNGALVRLLTMAQTEEPIRAKQGLQIVLACALGERHHKLEILLQLLYPVHAQSLMSSDRKLSEKLSCKTPRNLGVVLVLLCYSRIAYTCNASEAACTTHPPSRCLH